MWSSMMRQSWVPGMRAFSTTRSIQATNWKQFAGSVGSSIDRSAQRPVKLPASGKVVTGYVLHGQFTRNNIILTLCSQYRRVGKLAEGLSDQELMIDRVRPLQDVKISLSTGHLGYRNTKQGQYEAAFQTSARMFQLMEEKGYLDKDVELVFRQFSEGREAFMNALMGKEGNKIRPLIKRVTDASKIKFGGDRAPGKRRV
ncbi:small ribosomal subunit protein uS11m [Trichomonascus vanleenenianus]|uniref:mitochondrial 37S ribosomal protein uS11m MRPS18 n=1 Tax=Trichomonascus vanleenenianus TaxID=2268995 RepID=UPI003ECB0500